MERSLIKMMFHHSCTAPCHIFSKYEELCSRMSNIAPNVSLIFVLYFIYHTTLILTNQLNHLYQFCVTEVDLHFDYTVSNVCTALQCSYMQSKRLWMHVDQLYGDCFLYTACSFEGCQM